MAGDRWGTLSIVITGKEDRSELAVRHFTDKSQGNEMEVKTDVQIENQVMSTGETQAKNICVL
jgi:hypothetical protein